MSVAPEWWCHRQETKGARFDSRTRFGRSIFGCGRGVVARNRWGLVARGEEQVDELAERRDEAGDVGQSGRAEHLASAGPLLLGQQALALERDERAARGVEL